MNGRHEYPREDTPRRTEPVLGNLDQLDDAPRQPGIGPMRAERPAHGSPPPFRAGRRPEAPRRRPHPWRWLGVAIAVIVIGGGVWAFNHQDQLSALLPQTQLNSLLTRADKAYAAGNLSGSADSARDLYDAARALDPDNEQALTGLQNVGNAELKRAEAALKQRDYTAAQTSLEEARSLLGGGADVTRVSQQLAKAVLQHANVDVLVNQAQAALANGRIDGAGGAAALFRKVLAGDPGNPVAQHGMNQIGNLLAQRIQGQLAKQDRAGATESLSNLASLLPRYSQLPTLRASVAAAERAADAQRDKYLAQGQADLRAGKITGAGADNAEAQFKAALAADPGNARAEAGLGQVAQAMILQANAAIDSGNRQAAKQLLARAAALAPKAADLAAAQSRLGKVAGAQTAAPGSAQPSAPALTPAQSAKVARLVASAKAAARKGDIMLPPGRSAYDLYRAALDIDGNDADAQAGLRALPQVTRAHFDSALREDNLDKAHDMLGTLEQLDPGDPTEATLRHRLGSAWLDRAQHYVGLGEMGPARAALTEAQRLVPQDPRISEVDARIRRND